MLKQQLLSEKPDLTIAIGVIIVILMPIMTGLFHALPPAPFGLCFSIHFSSARAMATVRHIA